MKALLTILLAVLFMFVSWGCDKSFEPIENPQPFTLEYNSELLRGSPYVLIALSYYPSNIDWKRPVILESIEFNIERLYTFNKEPYEVAIGLDSLQTLSIKDTIETSDGLITTEVYNFNEQIDFIGIIWHQYHSTYLNIKAKVKAYTIK